MRNASSRRSPRPRRAAPAPPDGHERLQQSSDSAEGSLLESIAAGGLDVHLPTIARAIDARLHLLHTIESIDALAELAVGDHVRINQHARPRYLHGLHATITDIDAHAATITLLQPIGRFTSGIVRCPPLVVDRLGPGLG